MQRHCDLQAGQPALQQQDPWGHLNIIRGVPLHDNLYTMVIRYTLVVTRKYRNIQTCRPINTDTSTQTAYGGMGGRAEIEREREGSEHIRIPGVMHYRVGNPIAAEGTSA